MAIGDNIKNRREALDMTKSTLARALGTDARRVFSWENGESKPSVDALEPLARALNFSVTELLGITPAGLDLSGKWFAVWQTSRDRVATLNSHGLDARHAGEFVYFDASGDYAWLADMKLERETLTGTYRAVDRSRDERGSLYFVLSATGDAAVGGWQGKFHDGVCGQGRGVLARDEARADRLIEKIIRIDGPIVEWPSED